MNEQIYASISELEKDIRLKRKELIKLRKTLEKEPISDYELLDINGKKVMLSSLFDERKELLVIHNMGKACTHCTLWADGFNGVAKPLADRVPFVLVSPDCPAVQKEFSASRGWTFPMLSAEGSTLIADLGFYKEDGYWPGVSGFILEEGKIYRTGYDFFGDGDVYCSVWHLFDLLPLRSNGWNPKYEY